MGLVEVAKGGLLMPDGEVIDTRPKDEIVVADPSVRQAFIRFHEVASRYNLSVVCPRCDHAVVGANNDSIPGQKRSVACRCREWIFVA